jgi:hypothetical protein
VEGKISDIESNERALKRITDYFDRVGNKDSAQKNGFEEDQGSAYKVYGNEAGNKKGFCYIAKDDSGFYKIGSTLNLDKRERALRCGNVNLLLICSYCGYDYIKLESSLHKLFKAKRIAGEWFDLSENDLSFIEKFCGFARYLEEAA